MRISRYFAFTKNIFLEERKQNLSQEDITALENLASVEANDNLLDSTIAANLHKSNDEFYLFQLISASQKY